VKNFITPHCHVQSLDSASKPEAFAARELELETGAITVTDHGTLGACQAVYELAKKKKLTPILGLEGYMRDDNCPIILAKGIEKRHPFKAKTKELDTTKPETLAHYLKYLHFTTHFLDQEAMQTGIRLLSKAPVEQHGSEAKPLFDWKAMEELGAANVTLTTGCLIGLVQRHLLVHNDPEGARKYYERVRSMVRPGNFYVEIFPHVCTHNWVDATFITVEDPTEKDAEGKPVLKVVRHYAGKTLRTNVGDIKAQGLDVEFNRKGNKHTELIGQKDYHTWNKYPEPLKIVAVKYLQEFVQNECTPYAPGGDVQLGCNQFMIEMARKYGDPLLVSDDSHYAHKEEKIVQDVRLSQGGGSLRFFGHYHRQSSAEAFDYFKSQMGISEKEFEGWVENSHEWASRFKGFKLESKPDLPTKFYEEKYEGVGAKNSLDYTLHLIKKHGRYINKPEYKARLNAEIQLLYKNGVIDLLPYFMIDEEACDLYTKNGRLTGPGRGSAAGLLLSYYLGITHVDPLRYGLSLDRFLTLDRIKSGRLPDIDQDLPDRDLLVGPNGNDGWFQERFGDHVAQISTIMTLKLKSSVLDVARFQLGAVPKDIADLAHKFELPPQGLDDDKFVNGYEDSGSWVPGSKEWDPPLMKYISMYPDHWEIVQKCLGLGRSQGRHACAVVFGNRPIHEFIPLTKISGITCTQFTASAVEAMGGLKMDFLVVNSLNDIANCIKLVQERSGIEIPKDGIRIGDKFVPSARLLPRVHNFIEDAFADIWDLPEDQAVFADIAQGHTETVFQLNTPSAVQWLRHFGYKRPDGKYAINSIESMAAFTALDRPGPLDAKVKTPDTEGEYHNMLVEYARRARGADPSPDILPIFDQLFPETHGILVFQETLQKAYQELTGCTGAEAEEFRSNVAKKKKEKIMEAYPFFIERASKSLGSVESAEAIWKNFNTFAAYGFNKAHAVCYVIIAYACAYLKHHYPLEWWTAVLCNADKNEISEKFWKHCGKLIDLPDVTKAASNFEIIGERIQAPLSLLHGVGEAAHKELMEGAPYTSIDQFVFSIEERKRSKATKQKVEVKKKVKNEATGEEEKVGTGVWEEKTVNGRSSLHSGVVHRLIISGAMDKLFPPNTPTLLQLEMYEEACVREKERHKLATAPKVSKRKAVTTNRKPKSIDGKKLAKYAELTNLTRYQLRKTILPAYSESVLQQLLDMKHPMLKAVAKSRWPKVDWKTELVTAVTGGQFNHLSTMDIPRDGYHRVAVFVYVSEARVFEYGEKDPITGRRSNPKTACELILDLDGERVKVVKWPDREVNEVDDRFNVKLKDAIVMLIMSKWKKDKPFSVDDIEIIQPAPGEVPEPEETPSEESA